MLYIIFMKVFFLTYFIALFIVLPTVALNCLQVSFHMPILHSGDYCPVDQFTQFPYIADDVFESISQVVVATSIVDMLIVAAVFALTVSVLVFAVHIIRSRQLFAVLWQPLRLALMRGRISFQVYD